MNATPQLIVALDVPASADVPPIVDALPDQVLYYKIGLELFTSEGPPALAYLKQKQKRIFLDLKLHDIPRTVARAVRSAARHGVDLLTIHASGGRNMLAAATDAAAEIGPDAPQLLAITTLTSLNDTDLQEIGITRSVADHTLSLGQMAVSAGVDGLVCSVHEISQFRESVGADPILVTPGIRPAGAAAGDQKRVATPEMAVKAGANFLVVGRPIIRADDPAAAARQILQEIRGIR
jgi:orotidine-5'-phosphate decarboxylase